MRWFRPAERPPDWLGQQIEAASRRRIECLHPVWWRRIRREVELTLWGGWAFLIACGVAGIVFLISAKEYRDQKNHEINQVVQEAREIRYDLTTLLCRTSPSECPKGGPGGRRHEANTRLVPPGPQHD